MTEDKNEIQTIEEEWQTIHDLSKEKVSLLQISFEIGVNYDTLKKHVKKIALEKQVISGNITAIQISAKLDEASEFAQIKKGVWEL